MAQKHHVVYIEYSGNDIAVTCILDVEKPKGLILHDCFVFMLSFSLKNFLCELEFHSIYCASQNILFSKVNVIIVCFFLHVFCELYATIFNDEVLSTFDL